MLTRKQRALLALYAVVPYPFFFLGIPFATADVVTCFRATCIFFSLSSFVALAFNQYYHIACRSALFWNGFSSCVVSYAFPASLPFFVGFLIVENAFQYVSVNLLLEKKGRLLHVGLTFLGSVFGFLVRETSTEALDTDGLHHDRRLHTNVTGNFAGEDADKEQVDEEAMHWAVSLITLVCCLVLGMCAIGYLTTNTFSWLRRRRTRRSVEPGQDEPHEFQFDALLPEASVGSAPTGGWIDVEAEAAEAWERDIEEITGYLNTKSMRELKHLAATTCGGHKDLEDLFVNDLDRKSLIDKLTTDIACGIYDLAFMQPKHLRAIALRMGVSKCKSVGAGETMDPLRQVLCWIVLRAGQMDKPRSEMDKPRSEQSQNDSENSSSIGSVGSSASESSQWVSAKFVRFAIDEALAATPAARQRLRTHRASFTGQVGKYKIGPLSSIQEEEEEDIDDDICVQQEVEDSADEVSVVSPFEDDILSLSTCTLSTGTFV